jgi:hypothetical protein
METGFHAYVGVVSAIVPEGEIKDAGPGVMTMEMENISDHGEVVEVWVAHRAWTLTA